jgi:hypothetical protein
LAPALAAGRSWAETREQVGQRSRIVTADRYTHALLDYGEVDRAKLLKRARMVAAPVPPSRIENPSFARVS